MTTRVVLSRRELPGNARELLAGARIAAPEHGERPSGEELRGLVAGAHGLLALGNDVVDRAAIEAGGDDLRIVALASAGHDGVDLDAAAEHGVVVTHTPGVLAETTADLAFALVLAARRRLGEAADSLRGGGWRTVRMDDHLGLDVHGATLGLIGYGEIGRAVARRAHGFGMRVIHHSRSARSDEHSTAVPFSEVLAQADVLSLHVPATARTRHLIGAAELAAMKPTATLVNTARGAVVDQDSLLAALQAGRLHSAGLDVFAVEPVPPPEIERLAATGRLVALPHVGSATEATRAAMVDLAARNIADVLAGRPPRTPVPGTPVPTAAGAR